MAEPLPIRTVSALWFRLKSMLLPLPRKMVVLPSKDSTSMTPPAETVPVLETVTGMETLARPAETVMVPVPGAAAVKRPCSSTVPMSPVTSQVKASGSAFREMWL